MHYESGPGTYTVESSTRPAAAGWSAPSTIGTSDEVYGPRIAVDPAGDATLSWWGYVRETHSYSTWAEQRPAGGSWGQQVMLAEPGEETYFPAVDMDGTGGATAVWASTQGEEVIRTVYLPGPKPVTPEPEPVTPTPEPGKTVDGQPTTTAAPTPAVCSAVSASPSAETFVPTPKPGKTVPGVRARITVGVPSNVEVAATLSYVTAAKRHSVAAGDYSMALTSKGNLRIPLPSALRSTLPVGSKVSVSLRIAATPTSSGSCGTPSTAVHKLKLKVVKVLTGA